MTRRSLTDPNPGAPGVAPPSAAPPAARPDATTPAAAAAAVADPRRLAAVRATGLLDSEAEEAFDRLTRLAVRLLGVPAAFVSLVDAERDFYKSACGFGEPLASARGLTGPTFCHYTVQRTTPLVIPDTAADPAYRDVPTVRSLGVAAYVGVPLVAEGQPVGAFCAVDTRPRAWTAVEVEVLTELAASAQRELDLRAAAAVAESAAARLRAQQAELEAANQQLQEQATELEAQAEELHATAAYSEELAAAADVAHARTRGVLEAMADAYFALDADFRIADVNAAMERNVGQPRAALVGRSMWEAFPGTVGNVFEASYRRAAAGASSHFTHDYSDGRLELVTEVDVYPAEGGGVAVFWRDVTTRERGIADRERLLAAAQLARAEAEAANRAKGEFLAVMSHELRTPLNAIGGYAELLELGVRGPLTAPQREDLSRIRRANQHLTGIVTDILNFARLEAGQAEFRLAEVPLAPVVADVESLVRPQLAAKGLAFDHDACGPEAATRPHAVRADAEKLRQVLLNLLGNAVKFTDAGGRVALACETDAAAGVVRVRVSDTGRGIPAERLASIFEPFVQVDRLRTPEGQQGVGLGLAISRDLARGMGGDLTAESTPGAGSTFTLTLPRG